jgi:hypothetical protein
MGFIPIIVTLGGAILLFFMVVNYHLKSKKNQIIQLQLDAYQGLERLEQNGKPLAEGAGPKNLDAKYALIKQGLNEKQLLVLKTR